MRFSYNALDVAKETRDMDYGYYLTRDECGKNSKPKIIARSWDLNTARKIMMEAVKEEEAQLQQRCQQVYTVTHENVSEIHTGDEQRLEVYYEIVEDPQC